MDNIVNKTSQRFALTGGNVIDGTGAPPRRSALIISGDRIESIGGDASGCPAVDVSGCTLLPGFIHAHAHPGFKQMEGADMPRYDEAYLEGCLAAGITTVRDMGALDATPFPEIRAQRDCLNASGKYPRIVSAGKFIAAPGGYGGIAPIAVTSKAEAADAISRLAEAGADFVKTSLENGFTPDTTLPKLAPELLAAICDAARERGLRVAAHMSQSEPLRTLVQAGITDAGHAPYDPMDDALIELMVKRNIIMAPTLTLFRMLSEKYGAPFLDTALDNVRRFVKAGGRVAVGDDYIEPESPWYGPGLPYGELELLAQAGLTNMQVIIALTANGAEACGLKRETGALLPGMRADVVAVRGDPLKSLARLKDVRLVVLGGRIV